MRYWLSRRAERTRNAQNLYGSIVALSRARALYAEIGVPDTVEGRFEVLVLHMYLFLERLDGQAGQLAQDVVDRFFSDMDTSARELGAGDLAVPRQMRALAAVFRDRMAEYRAAAGSADRKAMSVLINRAVFSGVGGSGTGACRLERYVHEIRRKLAAASIVRLVDGRIGGLSPDGEVK